MEGSEKKANYGNMDVKENNTEEKGRRIFFHYTGYPMSIRIRENFEIT